MDYSQLADTKTIAEVRAALEKRNIKTELVANKEEALARLKELIPAHLSVTTGSSVTLDQIGFTDYLKSGTHPWKNLKAEILAEKDPAKQMALRQKSVMADYFLGSTHAITKVGQVLFGSSTGSQLPAYAFMANHVIWVVGTQKIVPDLNAGLKRIWEYCLPLVDKQMKDLGFAGSSVGKILIFEKENNPAREIRLIFVTEKLGY